MVSRAGQMSSVSSQSKSRSIKISACRSRDLGRPSGNSRLTAILSLFGGAAHVDSGIVEALATMQTCFNTNSTVMAHRLVEVMKHYYIPPEYELCVPLLGQRPDEAFSSSFNLSTDTLEAGLRFPPMIEACCEGWQISPSEMAPNSWRYLVTFLWECYESSITATRDLFMAYFRLSQGLAKYYLTARSGFRVEGAPSSNKGWKLRFFFISDRRG
ncbi:hypothetical protein BHE74_00046494 [Ensete ventricosum]|nr:hypothetical protein BHE74_00046494 [Ensete ventricosum]